MYLKYIGPTFLFKYHGNIKGKLLHHKTVKTSQMTHFGFWNLEKQRRCGSDGGARLLPSTGRRLCYQKKSGLSIEGGMTSLGVHT